MKKVLPYPLALMMFAGAIAHVIMPEFYSAMVPDSLPLHLANYLAAVIETCLGVLLIIPNYKKTGGLGFMLLMIAFLPFHVWDLFRDHPAVGPYPAPILRLLFQFLLIFAGYRVFKSYQNQ